MVGREAFLPVERGGGRLCLLGGGLLPGVEVSCLHLLLEVAEYSGEDKIHQEEEAKQEEEDKE